MLPAQEWALKGQPEDVYALLAQIAEGGRILQRDQSSATVEFRLQIGRFSFTTLEQVTFDDQARQIQFKQLRSPFFSVRTATEMFQLSPAPGGTTTLLVTGALHAQWGLIGWIVTRLLVRRVWALTEARHLKQLADRCEALFSKPNPQPS